MFSKAFWVAAFERAVKTAAQSALLTIGADQVDAFNGVDWTDVVGMGVGGAVISVLTSLAFGFSSGRPSAGDAEVPNPSPANS